MLHSLIIAVQHIALGIQYCVAVVVRIVGIVEPVSSVTVPYHILRAVAQIPAGAAQGKDVGVGLSIAADFFLHNLIHSLVVQIHLRQHQDSPGAAHSAQQRHCAHQDRKKFERDMILHLLSPSIL